MKQWAKQSGFTIVELLIVIVVIAILAAITVVAYTGIQGRANDVAVQSDLRAFANKVLQIEAETGQYPLPQS
ncbi:TPA: pilus assembly protein PilE, partial [Candidatus Saccharibacteria bacterium]|nr:pilus assembly protein PilE [Candidatus Saccharibacteria bacterium]